MWTVSPGTAPRFGGSERTSRRRCHRDRSRAPRSRHSRRPLRPRSVPSALASGAPTAANAELRRSYQSDRRAMPIRIRGSLAMPGRVPGTYSQFSTTFKCTGYYVISEFNRWQSQPYIAMAYKLFQPVISVSGSRRARISFLPTPFTVISAEPGMAMCGGLVQTSQSVPS